MDLSELKPDTLVVLIGAILFLVGGLGVFVGGLIFRRSMNSFDQNVTRLWNVHWELQDSLSAAANLEAYRFRKLEEKRRMNAEAGKDKSQPDKEPNNDAG